VPTFDFSAPFVAARIILPSGDAYPLWTNTGGAEIGLPAVPGQKSLQALSFLQEVQVEMNLSGLPKVSAQLSPPFEDGMKFLDSPLADGRLTNRLEVQLGYTGGTSDGGALLSPPYAVALVAPEVSIDVDVQINLKGQGLGSQAQRQPGRITPGRGETRKNLIRRLVAGEGEGRRTLEVDFSSVPETSEAGRYLNESAAGFVQGGRSDWFALWEMAERTQCFMLIVGPRVSGGASRLLWLPRVDTFSRPPTRRFRLYHYPGGRLQGVGGLQLQAGQLSEVELPILSFSCNTEAVWNALTYQDVLNHGAALRSVDPDSVEPSEEIITLEQTDEPVDSGEGGQTLTATDELPDVPNQVPGDPDNPDAVARAEAEVRTGAAMSLQCELETIGDPTILPGDMVALSGLGRRFDNQVYRVDAVTHSIGMGGFTTNLRLQSNVDAARSEGTRQPTGRANTTDVEDSPAYTASVHRSQAERARAELRGGG